MSDERLGAIERRMDEVRGDVRQFNGTVTHINEKLDGIAQAISSLARIEERQISTNERLSSGASKMNDHEERIRAIEIAVPDKLDERLLSIETKMPGLVESRKWVVMGVLAGIGMIGAALLHLVVKG